VAETAAPSSFEGVAAVLAAAGARGASVRVAGAGTKRGWGAAGRPEAEVVLSTAGLDRILEHNPGDQTAVIGAGVRLQRLQTELAGAGQMLALDPPHADTATVGGIFATADSGPLRHRYGTPRDQILGITVALSDGSIVRSGAAVTHNVAGYDLARLFCGSFGTLGVILSLSVRLQPLANRTVTALGLADSPAKLAEAAAALAAAPLELQALDVAWRRGRGGVLAQTGGVEARRRAGTSAAIMDAAGLTGIEITEADGGLWARQRAGQRSADRALVRVSARPSELPALLALADRCEATLVGRVASGVSYLELDPPRVGELRAGLGADAHAELLDRPLGDPRAAGTDPWDMTDVPALALMRAVKRRFDPAGICNPGLYVGGI
jgi:glycolate oxidase FAD binding subunit